MRTHDLKCWPGPFQAVLEGRKRFEYRLDDRGFEVGDELLLREWDPNKGRSLVESVFAYSGRELRARVTYRLGSEHGVPPGYCVLSIDLLSREES